MKTFTLYKKLAIIAAVSFYALIACQAQTTIFYGMTYSGGSNNTGTIIKFNSATNTDSVAWNFGSGTDGSYPTGDLTYNPYNGLYYGMTVYGGTNSTDGIIFSFNPANNAENVVWNFGADSDGVNPYGNLVLDLSDQLFYGLTYWGGANGAGTIFSFDARNNKEKVVWNFGAGQDGESPKGSLVFDPDNELFYGMTYNGGMYGNGTIFSYNPSGDIETILWDFTNTPDGGSPFGNLAFDTVNELLYGMTVGGGDNHEGSIINFNPSNNREMVVWSLGADTDGSEPYGSLVYDNSNGLFYGMASAGGTKDSGAIISFNPSGNKETVVWNLGSGTDGTAPYGGLVFEPDSGLFYGMTRTGGGNDDGAIIRFNPSDNKETVVWNFGNGNDGQYPSGDLVLYNPYLTAGVNNVSIASSINIFPNPSNGIFTVTGLVSGQTVKLYNCLGQMITSFVAENLKHQLDISNQANGFYIVQIFDGDGTPVQQNKIVKVN